jgi:Cu-Zn family superoxide dismutase
MKAIAFTLPALLLALAACQPSEDRSGPQDQGQPTGAEGQATAPADEMPEQPSATGAPGTGAAAPATGQVAAESAEAEILATEGQDTGGVIRFTQAGGGVRIEGTITGLKPGEHGFHIHANGDCSAPDASSAGGHFDSGGHPHGPPDSPPDQHHLGDFGNITADENGEAEVSLTAPALRMSGPDSIIGKAVIVHADPDDLHSQPSGNAGARVGCGVIQPVGVTAP